ncbi:MAG: terpene cyclase/mutase family protein [Planctomycetes bacterium]|nr:terpene cyclase/mutase family protein [Planctomycetota bacterium]
MRGIVTWALVLVAGGVGLAEEGPFDARMKDHKPALMAGGGSTGKGSTEEAVLSGLTWLARHQSEDGAWRCVEYTGLCPEDAPCTGTGNAEHDAGITAIVLLAFAGAGKTDLDKVEYADPVTGRMMCWGRTVQKGLEWMMAAQDADGRFGKTRGTHYMYNHLVAEAAVAEFYAMTASPVFEKAARAGLDFALAGQNPGSGWRYSTRSGDSDTSATAWGVTALMAARAAKIEIEPKPFADAIAWVDSATDEKTFLTGYTNKGTGKVMAMGKNEKFDGHETMTAAAMVVRIGSGEKPTSPRIQGAARALLSDPPKNAPLKIDYYYWYYGTEAMFLADGPKGGAWAQWNAAMKGAVLPAQAGKPKDKKDRCLEGSWDPAVDRWSWEGGRIMATALNVLTLEVYYRVRPAYVKGH